MVDERNTTGSIESGNDGVFHEVVLKDEDGNDVHFDHLLTFKYEDGRFIALLPLDDIDGVGDDEVLIYRIITDDSGEDTYVPIENDAYLEEVFDEFMRLLEEMDDDEVID